MSESQETRALTHKASQADMAEIMIGMRRPLLSSLDINDERGKELYALAMGDPDFKGKEAVGKDFYITDFLFHTYKVTDDKTGEVDIRPRLCLFTQDNQVYALSGTIGIESFVMLTGIWGMPPWNPPRHVTVMAAGRGYKLIPVRRVVETVTPHKEKKASKE